MEASAAGEFEEEGEGKVTRARQRWEPGRLEQLQAAPDLSDGRSRGRQEELSVREASEAQEGYRVEGRGIAALLERDIEEREAEASLGFREWAAGPWWAEKNR